MGGEGGNLGPGKVQTSNVLQNMERVGFFLWVVGFFLFWGWFGVFLSVPCCLVSDCFEITFLSFLFNSYSRESRTKKTLSSLSFVYNNWRSYKIMLQLPRLSQMYVCGNPNIQHYSVLV